MKIDTTKIPEFDALPEAVRNAILGMEFADMPDMSQYVAKSVFDKKASEAAENGRKLKERMTAEEAAKAENDARWAEMTAKVEQLEHEKREYTFKASYLAMGYDEKLATEAAKAMADGNMEKVFEIQKQAAEARDRQLREELMRVTPHPVGAGSGGDKNEVPENVRLAKELGKRRHQSQSVSDEIMKHYMK